MSQLLGVQEVAALCGVHQSTVRDWVARGRLAAVRLPSGQLRFRAEDIDALLVPTKTAVNE